MTMALLSSKAPESEIGIDDKAYPGLLRMTSDPPERLYCLGDTGVLGGGLAIVGARKATPYGIDCARMFSRRAAAIGLTIISGGAIGCDQEAARAALLFDRPTVVVAGGGADVCYPRSAGALFADILAHGGAIISERPWGSPPLRPFFVRRNRIIAGLSRAVLIVEAALGSGTFSTADAALAEGRDVLAVPGCIQSSESRGCNRLIAQGASAIVDLESFDDAVEQIFGTLVMRSQCGSSEDDYEGLTDVQHEVMRLLSAKPQHIEELMSHLGRSAPEVIALISEMEGFGLIERYRDGRYGTPVEHILMHARHRASPRLIE